MDDGCGNGRGPNPELVGPNSNPFRLGASRLEYFGRFANLDKRNLGICRALNLRDPDLWHVAQLWFGEMAENSSRSDHCVRAGFCGNRCFRMGVREVPIDALCTDYHTCGHLLNCSDPHRGPISTCLPNRKVSASALQSYSLRRWAYRARPWIALFLLSTGFGRARVGSRCLVVGSAPLREWPYCSLDDLRAFGAIFFAAPRCESDRASQTVSGSTRKDVRLALGRARDTPVSNESDSTRAIPPNQRNGKSAIKHQRRAA